MSSVPFTAKMQSLAFLCWSCGGTNKQYITCYASMSLHMRGDREGTQTRGPVRLSQIMTPFIIIIQNVHGLPTKWPRTDVGVPTIFPACVSGGSRFERPHTPLVITSRPVRTVNFWTESNGSNVDSNNYSFWIKTNTWVIHCVSWCS